MPFVESWIRVQHECPFCDFSAAFPEAEMTLWVSALTDLFQVTIPPSYDVKEVLKVGKVILGYSEAFNDAHSALFLTQQPYIEEIETVMAIADRLECMLIPPMTFHEGWETHRIVTRDQENLRQLVDEVGQIGTVEVLSLKARDHTDLMNDVGVVPTHFIEGLTDKQAYVLVTAFEAGLFDVPTRVKMEKVADAIGLSRSTFGEHLRKGEGELMKNLYPFLKLRCCREGDPFCGCGEKVQ
jgi:predicted DNA binding protein